MSGNPSRGPFDGLVLAELHRRHGAVPMSLDGAFEVPARYGSMEEEYEALKSGCGLLDRSWGDRLELSGEDRVRFLNAKVSCDLARLEPGDLTYGFFTSRQGKILADVTVMALEDRLWLQLPAGRGEEIRQGLEKFLLTDRVEIRELDSAAPIALIGPRAAEIVASLAEVAPGKARHVAARILGHEVRLVHRPLFTLEAITLWLPAVDAAGAAEVAEGLLATGGVRLTGFEAAEALRVERGAPRFGADFGPENLPQETGLDEAVSYTKGCYLGQEVVARIHYRGQVNRRLMGLVFDLPEPPERGLPLVFEGRAAGKVGSAVFSPALGSAAGLAILHRRAAEAGTRLELEGGEGITAEVRDLPLAVT